MPEKKFIVTFSSFQLLLLISHLAPTTCLPNAGSGSDSSSYHHGGMGMGMDRGYDGDHYDTAEHQQDGPTGSHGSAGNKNLSHGNCILDERWKGKWFQTGFPQPIYIDNKSIGPKGICLEKAGNDKFLFFHAPTNCHKCIVINERHRNILQYKETQYCEDKELLDTLCSNIPGDGPLFSLFRIDAQPVDCPFRGAPFTFTYNRGHGECRDPVSNVDACTESSRLLLRYQACPNIPKTESTTEELECLGEWKEGSNHYLIGKLDNRLATNSHEERYRCFFYERIKDHNNVDGEGHAKTIGYRVAQSGDASCTDISSPADGARALVLTKVEQSSFTKCKFPNWVMAHHWRTLDGKISVKTHHKNSTMHIVDESKRNSTIYSNIIGMHGGHFGRAGSSTYGGGTRIVCQTRTNISDRHVFISALRTEGCKSESVCLDIYKRDNHVIEMRIRQKSGYDDKECGNKNTIDKSVDADFYITLVSTSVSERRCPQLGKYMTTFVPPTSPDARVSRDACGVGGKDLYSTLVVGCGHKGTMEFHSKCATEEPIVSYMCHGNWEESGTGYLIATPLSRSSNSADRYCFIYTQIEGGLRVSRSSETCRTHLSPGVEGFWALNLTVDGQCAEPLTGSSTSLRTGRLREKMIQMITVFASVIISMSLNFCSSALTASTTSLHTIKRVMMR